MRPLETTRRPQESPQRPPGVPWRPHEIPKKPHGDPPGYPSGYPRRAHLGTLGFPLDTHLEITQGNTGGLPRGTSGGPSGDPLAVVREGSHLAAPACVTGNAVLKLVAIPRADPDRTLRLLLDVGRAVMEHDLPMQ